MIVSIDERADIGSKRSWYQRGFTLPITRPDWLSRRGSGVFESGCPGAVIGTGRYRWGTPEDEFESAPPNHVCEAKPLVIALSHATWKTTNCKFWSQLGHREGVRSELSGDESGYTGPRGHPFVDDISQAGRHPQPVMFCKTCDKLYYHDGTEASELSGEEWGEA